MPYIYINPVVSNGGDSGDPWAAFRGPGATADKMIAGDPAAITGPRPGPEVPSTNRVMGDREAEAAGLYETNQPKQSDPWAAFRQPSQPQAPPTSFGERFQEGDQRPDMQAALEQRATDMTRGPATSPAQNMDITESNVLPAATQGTSPNVSDYGGKLISKEAFQSDSGEILYRDPADGQVKPTDSKTQVAIRDPADNTVKIFARSEATNEFPITGISRVLAPGLAAGSPTARAVGTVTARGIKPGLVTSADVLESAQPYYKTFDKYAAVTPVGNRVPDRIKLAIERAGQSQQNADPVYRSVDNMVSVRQGPSITLADLRNLKEQLGKNFAKSPEARLREASKAASDEISRIINEYAPAEASAALKKADAIHAPGKSLEKIEQLQNVAKTTAAERRFGQSANEVMRGLLGNIVKKMEATRKPGFSGSFMGFKPEELSAIRDITEGRNAVERGIRTAAALAPEKGIMRAAVETGHAAYTGGAGLVIPSLGVAGDVLTRVLDAKQLSRLKDLIAKRSPAYSEAVKNAVERLQKAQETLQGNPSPKTFAAYVAASRSMSAGLTRDGIQIGSGDFIRLLQSPAKSAAESDQQEVPGQPSQ